MKYANYANYLIKYAFYRETPGLIEFYRKNYIRLNLGTFDTPRHKILTGFPLSTETGLADRRCMAEYELFNYFYRN